MSHDSVVVVTPNIVFVDVKTGKLTREAFQFLKQHELQIEPLQMAEYTVATVPSAADYDNHSIIVSNEAGGRTLATSDGTSWRRCSDGAIIS